MTIRGLARLTICYDQGHEHPHFNGSVKMWREEKNRRGGDERRGLDICTAR